MASLFHVGGSGRIYRSDASGVILRLDDFGNVYVSYGGVEMGQGLHAALSYVVAETLGVTPDRVFINPTDTATCPWDVGTHASRGIFVAGNAALGACDKARARILELAAGVLPRELKKALDKHQKKNPGYEPPPGALPETVTPDQLEIRENEVLLRTASTAEPPSPSQPPKPSESPRPPASSAPPAPPAPPEPWQAVPLDRVLRAAHFRTGGQMITVEHFYDPPTELPDWAVGRGNMSASYAWGTQGVRVAVDEQTGEVEILDFVAAHDVGRVIHPQTLDGQMYGAIAQGLGFTFTEELLSEGGRILNTNFRDYKIPTAGELCFPIRLRYVETDDPAGPYGAKGVGEPGLVPTAPAIANAIWDAVGVRVPDLPITPEKLRAALRARDREQDPTGQDPTGQEPTGQEPTGQEPTGQD
jgi:xanthine dehydrogenase molybdenum-binding subunit